MRQTYTSPDQEQAVNNNNIILSDRESWSAYHMSGTPYIPAIDVEALLKMYRGRWTVLIRIRTLYHGLEDTMIHKTEVIVQAPYRTNGIVEKVRGIGGEVRKRPLYR